MACVMALNRRVSRFLALVARLALRKYAVDVPMPASDLAYINACLAEGARPQRLCHVFRQEAFVPNLLWLLDRNAVESVRLAFPPPLLRIVARLALRLGRISRSDFEQASTWLRVI